MKKLLLLLLLLPALAFAQSDFEETKALAEQGNADAQNSLGRIYYWGEGVLKDPVEGFKWYKKAADQGNASSQLSLGIMFANGEGILKDLSLAKFWIKKAYENQKATASTVEIAEKKWNEFKLWDY